METILSVSNLVKRYGDNIVVKNASFELEKGKIYGLLGPNGAGKTTIMKLICNLIKKDGGVINYKDDLKIKYLMDVPMFYEYMKVEEYLMFIADLNNLENKENKINELLVTTNLIEHRQKKIKELSRGLRQKLGIASILVSDIDLLILDEPISALDPIGRKETLDLIKSLRGKVCVIFSSHILVDIENVCDNILLIHNGKILVNDSCENILTNNDYLLVKCSNREQALSLKEVYQDSTFSSKYENTLEIRYENLINMQLDILKNAKKLNVNIDKIEVKKESLEDIFLSEVTKHE